MRRAEGSEGVLAAGADSLALDDLRAKKDEIGGMLSSSLPPHVLARLLSEFRQYVTTILAIERAAKKAEQPDRAPSKIDELKERRRLRHAAIREQYGTGDAP